MKNLLLFTAGIITGATIALLATKHKAGIENKEFMEALYVCGNEENEGEALDPTEK